MNQQSSNLIQNLLSGNLSPGTTNAINDAAATQAVASGMPGSSRIGGTLSGNRVLRDIGLTSEGQQQRGLDSFLKLLTGYSGTVMPTTGQQLQNQQFNTEMDFRRGEADRQFGLQQGEADLAAAKFNQLFGPKPYGTVMIDPGTGRRDTRDEYYTDSAGRISKTAMPLMFKYRG